MIPVRKKPPKGFVWSARQAGMVPPKLIESDCWSCDRGIRKNVHPELCGDVTWYCDTCDVAWVGDGRVVV